MVWSTLVGFLSGPAKPRKRTSRPAKVRASFGLERLEDREVPASLGTALNYNALVFGSLTVPNGSDTEGRLAVAGTATFQNNYVVGAPPPNSSPSGAQLPLDPTRDDLIVGGNVANTGGISWVVNANAVYQGTYTGALLRHADGATRQQSPIRLASNGNAVTTGGQSFADLKADLQAKSQAWAGFADRGAVTKYVGTGALTLQGNDTAFNVFNITAAQWSGTNVIRTISAPAGSTVLINIAGASINVSGGDMRLSGVDQEHVLLNFYQATTINSTMSDIHGSVLAPLASAVFSGGNLNGNAVFGGNVTQGGGAEFHNFHFKGDVPTPASPPPVSPPVAVSHGETATIGFWANKNGQALIRSFNGGATSTALGNWLAANFPHMYGASAGSHNLAGKTNDYIANLFVQLKDVTGQKLDAQVLGVALAVYATTSSLGGQAATQYGFKVTSDGLGARTYNVGSSGAAFGVSNGTTLTVMQILKACDAQAVGGVLYGGNTSLRNMANTVFDGINQKGDI